MSPAIRLLETGLIQCSWVQVLTTLPVYDAGAGPALRQPLAVDVADLPGADSDSEISATSLQVSAPSQGTAHRPVQPQPQPQQKQQQQHMQSRQLAAPLRSHSLPSPTSSAEAQSRRRSAPQQQPDPHDLHAASGASQEHTPDVKGGAEKQAAPAAASSSSREGARAVTMASSSSETVMVREQQQREVRILWSTCERAARSSLQASGEEGPQASQSSLHGRGVRPDSPGGGTLSLHRGNNDHSALLCISKHWPDEIKEPFCCSTPWLVHVSHQQLRALALWRAPPQECLRHRAVGGHIFQLGLHVNAAAWSSCQLKCWK